MGIIKKMVTCVLLIFISLALGLTGAFLLVDNTTLLKQIFKQIESATGTRVSYDEGGVITRTLSPMITINDLKIENPDTRLKMHTSLFQLQISLPGLLKGNLEIPKLVLGNTRVEIDERSGAGKSNPARLFSLRPILHDIQISQVSIIYASGKISMPGTDIKQLKLKTDPETDKLICNLKTQIGDNIFDVVTILPPVQKIIKQQRLLFSLAVVHPYLNLSSDGSIGFHSSPPTIAANVQAKITDLVRFLPLTENLPISGDVSAAAQISGTFNRLGIRKCSLNVKTINDLNLNMAGQLDLAYRNGRLQTENMDFKLDFTSPNTYLAQTFLFDKIPKSGIIQGQAEIHSAKGPPSLENIVIKTSDSKEIKVALTGRIGNIFTFSGFNLGVDIRLDKPNWLAGVLPERLDPLNLIHFSTQISGSYKNTGIRKCRLNIKTVNELDLNIAGQLDLTHDNTGMQVKNTDLKASFTAPTTGSAKVFFFDAIPEFGAIQGQADIRSTQEAPSLENIVVQIKDVEGIQVDLKGRIKSFPFDPDTSITGYDLNVNMKSSKTTVMGDRLGIDLLIAGPLEASYSIKGDTQSLRLEKINLSSGEKNGIRVNTSGRIVFGKWDQTDPIKFIDLVIGLNSQTTGQLGEAMGKHLPEFGRVTAQARLHTVSENHRLDDIQAKITGKKPLQITVKGLANKVVFFPRPAVKGIEFNTLLTADKTRINATTYIISRNGIPGISGKIVAQNLFFPDLFKKKNHTVKNDQSGPVSFFSRTPLEFEWLKKADLDLLVDIASFDHDKLNLESAKFKIDLDSGHLAIESGRMVFPKGEVTFDAHLELEKDLNLSVKASGTEIDPWHTLSMEQTKLSKSFNADLDIDIDITTSGASEYELFSNMNGDVYIILKNGKIRKELIDMLFTDLIGWTIGKTVGNKKYVAINCGVMDYRIKKGNIITDAFFLDGKNMTIAGEGTIDLAKEQIAYVFLPKKKSRLVLNAEPVKVNGPLSNPKVTVIPWKSAIANYGTLFFGPYVFVGVSAFKYLTNTLRRDGTISPCLKYEKTQDQNIKDTVDSPP